MNNHENNNIYVVHGSGNPGWRECPRCQVGISLWNPAHEGKKFEALLQWATANFDSVILNISDTLYRHNLVASGMGYIDALACSREMGREWHIRNDAAIRRFSSRISKIHHWDDWRKCPEFYKTHNAILDLYALNPDFEKSIEDDVNMFIQRRHIKDPEEIKKAKKASTSYILEELAGYLLIARAYKPNRVYPSKDLKSFEFLRQSKVPDDLKGLEEMAHVKVNFKKRSSQIRDAA